MFLFFNDTATTEIYTLSLHDALPISLADLQPAVSTTYVFELFAIPNLRQWPNTRLTDLGLKMPKSWRMRSEEHTSELQSPDHLVCRLLLEKKQYHRYHYYDLRLNSMV